VSTPARQPQRTLDVAIGATGTALLFAVVALWPIAAPAMAAATWLHLTVECAVAGECEGLMTEKRP
jgi:hypothetical protein